MGAKLPTVRAPRRPQQRDRPAGREAACPTTRDSLPRRCSRHPRDDPHRPPHIITGGPGSGKSTLIEALAQIGIATSREVGRAIIREQVAIGGTALPWLDHFAFAEKMLTREIAARDAALATHMVVLLDRGIPDVAGFLRVSGLAVPLHIDTAARTCRYNPPVFIAPWWPEIFTADAERKQTPDEARDTFAVMVETYRGYDYDLVELPRATIADRVTFVRERLRSPR